MNNNLYPIAKEGFNYVAAGVVAFIVFTIFDLDFLEFIAFLATLFFLFVFRNPERAMMHYEKGSIAAPIDGTVVAVEPSDKDGYATKVVVDSSYMNVGVLRAPIDGEVVETTCQKGARLSKNSPLAPKLNEKASITFRDAEENSVAIEHTLKQSFTGIHMDIKENTRFMQGTRYGVMIDGVTTIHLPNNFKEDVVVGSEVKACETLLGYFS